MVAIRRQFETMGWRFPMVTSEVPEFRCAQWSQTASGISALATRGLQMGYFWATQQNAN
jgi:hypothetical protein